METVPRFLAELYGQFNSGIYKPRKKLIEPTAENRHAFERFLAKKWANQPDALPAKLAAELIGCAPQRVGDWMRKGVITSISICGIRYCSKAEFIMHCASPAMLVRPGSSIYRALIIEFLHVINGEVKL